MNGLLQLLLSLSLGGSILALLVLGLRLLLGSRLPSSFYYYAWLLVLLRLVLPIPGFLGLGAENEAASLPIPSSQYSYVDSAPRERRASLPPPAKLRRHCRVLRPRRLRGSGPFSPHWLPPGKLCSGF